MNPAEYSDISLGYIDLDTGEEFIVDLPEVATSTLVYEGLETPGYVYAVGRSVDDKVGVYRLENKLLTGTGKFSFKNIEGVASSQTRVRDSITAAYNCFMENSYRLIAMDCESYDYSFIF